MPGVVKVWENVPVEMTPESQTSGPLCESLVEEWNTPAQTQVTFSPGATITLGGEKAVDGPTATVWSPAAQAQYRSPASARRARIVRKNYPPGRRCAE